MPYGTWSPSAYGSRTGGSPVRFGRGHRGRLAGRAGRAGRRGGDGRREGERQEGARGRRCACLLCVAALSLLVSPGLPGSPEGGGLERGVGLCDVRVRAFTCVRVRVYGLCACGAHREGLAWPGQDQANVHRAYTHAPLCHRPLCAFLIGMADTTGNTGKTSGNQGKRRRARPTPAPVNPVGSTSAPASSSPPTGVGAGDLVATLIAGANFGYTLLWAAVLGCLVKISLAEAAGRWHLSTGRTLFDGWASLGRWTTWFFVVYVVIWGFVYGAAAMSLEACPSRRCSRTSWTSSGGPFSPAWSAWSSSGSTSTRSSRRS